MPLKYPVRLSIILPTWNGAQDLERLLPALLSQERRDEEGVERFGPIEICAVDSSSSDGTLEVLERYGARVEVIAQDAFGHGRTRNRCARLAAGEILVFLSQDVLPSSRRFLLELLKPFADERVAGVTSRVVPHPDDDALTARTVMDLPEFSTSDRVHHIEGKRGVWELDPWTRAEMLRFNNVASAVRADIFQRMPFPDVAFGEDFAWASRALTAGYRIAFAPRAEVCHAHAYSISSAFERYRVDALFHYLSHGLRVRPTLRSCLKGFFYEVLQDARFILGSGSSRGRARSLLRSPGLRAAQVIGQYLGSRGWQPAGRRLPGREAALHL